MASRACWVCQVFSHMTLFAEPKYDGIHGAPFRQVWAPFTCDNCGAMTIGTLAYPQDSMMGRQLQDAITHALENDNLVKWLPERPIGKAYADVPDRIASAASEANECASIGAYRGSVMLARAVIEATAKNKGITNGTLYGKIEALADQDFIRAHIKETAHEIRHLGNDMAHGDFDDDITKDDATHTLALMDEVLMEVFQSIARTKRIREAREAKKAGGGRGS